jgi:phthiocerol/phenolphthiocerol synthesis type-I polyketide synthase E
MTESEWTGLELAVVGMAGRFPGASDVAEFWSSVLAGTSSLREFSADELRAAGVSGDRPASHVAAGGVVDGAEEFDARFFGYSPREAALLDPQQRLFLQTAWHALEDAGHRGGPDGPVIGVYASATISTYLLRHLVGNPAVPGGLSPLELVLGNDKDTLATRVAYHLGLTGPAISVQSACSSSLVAVHLAAQALLGRDCDLAIAGGVSIRLPQHEGYTYTEGSILAPDGQCRPFDAEAAGVVGGNGVAAVVLRRLDDALREGDTIHAVIKGTAINNDGSGKVGFTAPGVTGQAAVIRAALEVSEVDSSTIGYVEAHGTGTALGDPIEVAALRAGFGGGAHPGCAIGSVKALVGHLDAAAGVTGLIKAVLAVEHGVIPPSPYLTAPNPELRLADGPFRMNRAAESWPPDFAVRRAGVSGFGMGGTNAHVIVEQPPPVSPSGPARPHQLLVLAAASPDSLAAARAELADALADAPGLSDAPDLADVAHTLRLGRDTGLRHRFTLVARDRNAAVAGLREGGRVGQCPDTRPDVVFLFPGQGAQYVSMAGELYAHEPVFAGQFDECAQLLAGHLGTDLRAVVRAGADADLLRQTRFAQPALFAVEYSLAALWRSWGVRPAAMLGHSVGEYAAACLAGCFSLADALALVAARGRLMQALPGGSMLAVGLSVAEVTELLSQHEGISLAASNAPALCTVSGEPVAVDALAAELTRRGVHNRQLHTSHAFHSAMVEPMLAEFGELVAAAKPAAPAAPFVSNATGDWITAEQAADPGYWVRHARQAVRFSEGLRTALAGGPKVLLEVGPGNTLGSLAGQHGLGAGGHQVLGSLRHPRQDRPDLDVMFASLGRLWLAGGEVDLGAVTADERRRRVPLPGYPFRRDRHWIELPSATPVPRLAPVPAEPTVDEEVRDAEFEVVTEVWRELLGLSQVGPDDDFFELGGHSLLATRILARIGEQLGVRLPPGAIFDAPTVRGLAELARKQRAMPDEDETARVLAEIRSLSPEQLQAELDRENALWSASEESPRP